MRLSKIGICFFRSLHLQQWVQMVRSRTFMILRIQMVHLIVCNLMRLIATYAPPSAPFDETSGKTFWSHGSQYNGSKDGKGVLGLVDLSIEVLVCLAKGARMKAVGIFHARIKAKLAV